MATSNTFHCSVVTPERAVLEREAVSFVALPTHDGEVGVMQSRAPLLCRLGIGELRVEEDGTTTSFYIDGGFAQMVDNRLTVLTEKALRRDALAPEMAERAKSEAEGMSAIDEASFEERQKTLQRARILRRMSRAGGD